MKASSSLLLFLVSIFLAVTGCKEKDNSVAVTDVTLDQSEYSLKRGNVFTLTASIEPSEATNREVTWKSDHPEIAGVDENGLVSALSEGVATITVITNDGNQTATCKVTVENRYDSYNGLVMAGYQGWFTAEGDGLGRGWFHYGFSPGGASIDFFPDMSEYTKIYKTPYKMPDGLDAYAFSSYDEESVDLHFRWMKEYGIDGAFMVRFVSQIAAPIGIMHFNKVLESALKAARKYDVAISVLYDMSSCTPENFHYVENDWKNLQTLFALADREQNPTYLWHNNNPLLCLWGVSFKGRHPFAADLHEMIIRLKQDNNVSIMLGVPYFWRTLTQDAESDPALHTLIKSDVDIVQPWAVGRYSNDNYASMSIEMQMDILWCRDNKVDYVPLVFPGFSWANLQNNGLYDQFPRMRGDFLWRQVVGAKEAGATALFVAMFDEMDEGTAIFKCAETGYLPIIPAEGKRFVGIERGLGTDYYLWLTGEAAKWFHGNTGYSATKPQR